MPFFEVGATSASVSSSFANPRARITGGDLMPTVGIGSGRPISTRPRLKLTLLSLRTLNDAFSANRIFLRTVSIPTTRDAGRMMAMGIAGMPGPVPMSTISYRSFRRIAPTIKGASESITISSIIRGSSLGPTARNGAVLRSSASIRNRTATPSP